MALREQLLAVADELRRLKAEGRKTISISDDTVSALKRLVEAPRRADFAPSSAPILADGPTPPPKPAPVAAAPAPAAPRLAPSAPAASPAPATPAAKPSSALFGDTAKAPVFKVAAPTAGAAIPAPEPLALPAGDKPTQWNWLRDHVVNHSVCKAHVRPGKKVVLGVGTLDASIFFCGEAPGADEEILGEPFVGAAGQLLTKMIKAMGLDRPQVYIGNIMNWRPEMPTPSGLEQLGNRPPTPEEMAFCLPFLRAQLSIVQPKLIVALGATAAKGLLGEAAVPTLGAIRGRWQSFAGVPVMVTYHPSYLLRNNSTKAKRAVWEDLLMVMERAGMPISEKQRNYFLEK